GNTWVNSSDGLESLVPFQDLIISYSQNPLNENQFTLATSNGIFTSTNGGDSWQQIADGVMHHIAHSTETNGHIVAATHNSNITDFKLHYSVNGGENWEEVENDALYYLASGHVFSSTAIKFFEESAEAY